MEIRETLSKGWERLTTESLPGYALHYYDALKAQFETLEDPSKATNQMDSAMVDAYNDAKRVVETPREALNWTDLMLLDLSIVRVLSFECLRLKVAELRHRLAGYAVPLPQELSPKIESVGPDKIAVLRCEAESLVTQIWHVRIARNSRDRYVGELRGTVFHWMLVIGVMLLLVPYFLIERPPLYFIIFTTGMMGALISILRRLQAATEAVALNLDQNSDLSALAYEKRAIVISLLAGGVFAILLYVVFVAGFSDLSGKLAPEFIWPEAVPKGGVNFSTFVNDVGPKTGADYAKTVVWSFAAGFFEQLVPDVLDRLVKRDQKSKQ